MKRQIVFASSILLALAAGTVSFTSTADAAVIRHHGGGHSMSRSGGGRAMARSSGGHRYAVHRGNGRWARGGGGYYGGGYYGGYYDYCGPVQLALGLCRPYYAPYGPFGIL
ncbi:hypothetical protein LGH82_28355 [Mesorhizobium sp. PAMC28654]|uniref:hypothetical protein n=1 Tax=Mesorhizobium sp. PAMC28654 TaxID=2880934 RepID=UPI001D0AE275|nr:hypothetical protein [Mesorhizobium sp. PAMC28654]UDL88969.1 hypothetical protein LGH82_28355 [Mesorhizobium sp. PAMC28654]